MILVDDLLGGCFGSFGHDGYWGAVFVGGADVDDFLALEAEVADVDVRWDVG